MCVYKEQDLEVSELSKYWTGRKPGTHYLVCRSCSILVFKHNSISFLVRNLSRIIFIDHIR